MNEKLIKYLSGEMNPPEEQKFLEELKNSPELIKQKIRYEDLMKDIRSVSSAEVNEDYFSGIIPEFRNRIEKKKRTNYSLKWASGIAVSAAAILLAVMIIFNDQTKSFDEMMLEMDSSEIAGLIQEHNIDLSVESENSVFEEMYYDMLDINGETGKVLQSSMISDAAIYNSLTENESELIFAELINKDLSR
jgi:hypothetical protein